MHCVTNGYKIVLEEQCMAENDIYNNEGKYQIAKNSYRELLNKPEPGSKRKYWCKNPKNIEYFPKLFMHMESRDQSYVRRNRLLNTFRLIIHIADKDLKECGREDADYIVAYMHGVYKSANSKSDFIRDMKLFWKILFPELDEKGRVEDGVVPYNVRHLKAGQDISTQKRKLDKLTWEEFERIVQFFSNDRRIQFFLTLALESLARPQEILYTKISDIEQYDNYAKIWVSEHGKEGVKFLQVINSYPYLLHLLEKHQFSKDKDSYIFINSDGSQMKPANINKKLRIAMKSLNITKPITCYSIKRNGVTFRRLRGDDDVSIQHVAGWKSTKQLKTYDLSGADDVLKLELIKQGKIKDDTGKDLSPKTRDCIFCNTVNGFTEEFCKNCKQPLDRDKIRENELNRERNLRELTKFLNPTAMEDLFKVVNVMQNQIADLQNKEEGR